MESLFQKKIRATIVLYFLTLTGMKLSFHEKNSKINERQQELYTEKLERLVTKLGTLWNNESSEAKIIVTHNDTKSQNERFDVEVLLQMPGHKLVASTTDVSPDNALDSCIEKLKKQIEKVKTK